MPTSARSLSTRPLLRALALRRLLLALGSTAIVSAALLAAAAPAGAIVKTVAGTAVGLQPHSAAAPTEGSATAASFENESGHPVLHTNATYAIYWDPDDAYHGDWQHLIDHFLQGVGAESGNLNNVFAVDSQYTDKSNRPAAYASTFMGAYTDTNPYPTAFPANAEGCKDPKPLEVGDAITCVTDKQVREQLQTFIVSQHGLAKGMGSIFYLLTPPGVAVCLESGASPTACSSDSANAASFCSYHSDISPTNPLSGDENTILYAVIPWVAGGFGDYHMGVGDQAIPAFQCQDGGYNPSGKPIEQAEHAKERDKVEQEAFTNGNTEEKEKIEEQEAREGPHAEEPNQDGIGPDGSPDTGLADVIISQIGAEQQDTVTDPLLDAWQDSAHNEATDECRNWFATTGIGGAVTADELTGAGSLFNQVLGGGDYYLNDAFNLAALRLGYPGVPCLAGASLVPQFTSPNPVKANELVGFNGMESNITLNAGIDFSAGGTPEKNFATYTWNFGDGSSAVSGYAPGAPACSTPWLSPCAASEFHAYQYGGTYPVTLTVTDVGGNVSSVTNQITVVGPPPPGSASSGGSGSGSSGSPASGGGSSPAPAPAPAVAGPAPGPVAAASSLSKSLASALTGGLVVRYSVSEQVAGHFEVLLAASVAHKIGLHGPAATGLAKGAPAEIVIAKDILVTTRGGSNTVKIKFSKNTAARLRRLHKVSLMLRLVVRNAAKSPLSTTTVSTVTLTG